MTAKPDDNAANILAQIRELSRDFGKEISQGKSPRIQSYLKRVSEEGQENLFTHLLAMEINFRRSKGESPTSADYAKRFPQFKKQVRRAFFEPTLGSVDSSVHGDGDDQTASLQRPGLESAALDPTFELPDANRLGDYELVRKLGQGGMGIVYEALHTKTHNRVALKTLPTGGDGQQVNADKLYRFRKEFRGLSEINHPNLVGMQSLEVDGERWFFTMDLIDGEDFLSHVRPDDQLDEDRLRSCLKQLATGVLELHRRGIIHRDLKPSNVLVSSDGHVTILDFGLAAQLQRSADMTQTNSGMFAGTPPYAAPEQMFGERTEASDWYAFGTMLYEALAGERPFQDPDPMKLLRMKQEQDPPQLAGRNGVPSDLSTLADGLLRREPGLRLSSEAIGTTLGLQEETRIPDSTRGSQGSANAERAELEEFDEEEIVLIGREKQLAQLEEIGKEFESSRDPKLVWITGLSGEGKSTLAKHFLRPLCKDKKILVLAGRCYDRESVPFKVIDSVIEPLVHFLRSFEEAELRSWLPKEIGILTHLFPVLRRVEAIRKIPPFQVAELDDQQLSNRAFEGLRTLLRKISERYPVVFFMDDLQWGDADSSRILAKMLFCDSPPWILLIGSFRSDEMETSPFLREWETQLALFKANNFPQIVIVESFSESECLQLLSRRLEKPIEELRCAPGLIELIQNTRGNPYFLEQLLDGFDTRTGQFKSVSLAEIINARLTRCDNNSKSLLEVIAVAGKAVPLDQVADVVQAVSPVTGAITQMRSERLVRLVGSYEDQLVDTYHDKIRETVLSSISLERRQDIHHRFASRIASRYDVPGLEAISANSNIPMNELIDLAHHSMKAEAPGAYHVQLLAGEAALDAFAVDNALEHLTNAERLQPKDVDSEIAFRLQFAMAEALSGTRQVTDAESRYRRALELTSQSDQLARCQAGLAIAYVRMGKVKQSRAHFEAALRLLGERQPRSLVSKLFAISLNLARILFWPFDSGSRSINDDTDTNEIFLSKTYSHYRHVTDLFGFAYVGIRVVVLSRRWGNVDAKAMAYSNLALQMGLSGIGLIACHFARKAESLIQGSKSDYAVALTKMQLSAHYLVRAELAYAESLALESLPVLRKGRDYAYYMSLHWLRHIASAKGDAAGIKKWSSLEKELGDTTKDDFVIAYAHYGLADAFSRIGDVEAATQAAERSVRLLVKHNSFLTPIASQELARALLQGSEYKSAEETASDSIREAWKEWSLMELCLDSYAILVEAIGADHWHRGAAFFSRPRKRFAARMARRSRIVSWFFPSLKPHALRVSGRASVILGKTARAEQYFARAIKSAQESGADFECARTLIDRSMLEGINAEQDRSQGLEKLEYLGCVLPDAEVEYLGIDREAHHARAAEARAGYEAELQN